MCCFSDNVDSEGAIIFVRKLNKRRHALIYGNNVRDMAAFNKGAYMFLLLKTSKKLEYSDLINMEESEGFLEELAAEVLPERRSRGGKGFELFGSRSTLSAEVALIGNWVVAFGDAGAIPQVLEDFKKFGLPVPKVNLAQVRALQPKVQVIIGRPAMGVEATGYNPFGLSFESFADDEFDIVTLEGHHPGVPEWGPGVLEERDTRFIYASDDLMHGVEAHLYSEMSAQVRALVSNCSFIGCRFEGAGPNGNFRMRHSELVKAYSVIGGWKIPYRLAPRADYMV